MGTLSPGPVSGCPPPRNLPPQMCTVGGGGRLRCTSGALQAWHRARGQSVWVMVAILLWLTDQVPWGKFSLGLDTLILWDSLVPVTATQVWPARVDRAREPRSQCAPCPPHLGCQAPAIPQPQAQTCRNLS